MVTFSQICTSALQPTSEGFQAEFCTEADFLQTPSFPCVPLHEMIGSGQLSSEGYLYRY